MIIKFILSKIITFFNEINYEMTELQIKDK